MSGSATNVTIDSLSRSFESSSGATEALTDFSLEIKAGEFVSLVGPSGCGKSTLLRIVAGLDTATGGAVQIGGKAVSGPDPRHGVVFQRPALFPWLDVLGNATFGPRMQGRKREAGLVDEARAYLAKVGLAGFERHKVYELSGGMQHRLALARVLINRPSLMLLDEPFGALDAQTRAVMQELLMEVWAEDRSTMLFITHDVEEALMLSDRAVVMTARPGRLKAEYEVDLPRPRSVDVITSARFGVLKAEVLGAIREETRVTEAQEVESVRRRR